MFIIIEMQTSGESTAVVTPIKTEAEYNKALNKYYNTLAAAAVSTVDVHTVMLIDEKGETVRVESFDHKADE